MLGIVELHLVVFNWIGLALFVFGLVELDYVRLCWVGLGQVG